MDWIDQAQDRDQWRGLVNTVWTVGFHKMLGNSWIAAQLAAFQEGLSSMKLGISVNRCAVPRPIGARFSWRNLGFHPEWFMRNSYRISDMANFLLSLLSRFPYQSAFHHCSILIYTRRTVKLTNRSITMSWVSNTWGIYSAPALPVTGELVPVSTSTMS
jgi:hypothetical protein